MATLARYVAMYSCQQCWKLWLCWSVWAPNFRAGKFGSTRQQLWCATTDVSTNQPTNQWYNPESHVTQILDIGSIWQETSCCT